MDFITIFLILLQITPFGSLIISSLKTYNIMQLPGILG